MLSGHNFFYQFTVGPAAKKPMQLALEELSPSEAAEFATGILIDVSDTAFSALFRV